MTTLKTCKDCNQDKPENEFYVHRWSCKKCVIEKQKSNFNQKHSKDVETIKCIKCTLTKSKSEFRWEQDKQKYSVHCLACIGIKILPSDDRYISFREYFKGLNKEDLNNLKEIIEKILLS